MNQCLPQDPFPQRSHGVAEVALGAAAPHRTGLLRLRQAGSGKAIVLATPAGPEVVFLNTSGGITGGDRLGYALDLAPGARATATTQTAERAYRSDTGTGRVDVTLTLGAGSHLDWLPQETILFDASALSRRTRIDLAPGAAVMALEMLVLGRAAMGETVTRIQLSDRREIRRNGRLVHLEPLRLTATALASGPAGLNGLRATASLVVVAQGAEDALNTARAALDVAGVVGAASGMDGRLVVRLMATDGWPLRRQVLRLLAVLRRGPVPRVWQI